MRTAFDPANEVERLMLEAHADSGAMTAFLQALVAGQAWVPGAGSGAGSIRTVAAGETLSLPTSPMTARRVDEGAAA